MVWSPFVVGRCKRSGRYFASRESSQEHTISIRQHQSAACKKTERPVWLLREIRTEATRGKDDRALLLEVLACFIFFRNGFTRGLGQHAASLLVQDAAHRAVVHQELLHLGLTTLQAPPTSTTRHLQTALGHRAMLWLEPALLMILARSLRSEIFSTIWMRA